MKSENSENIEIFPNIGEMKKRRVLMADGRRYLIYYTFDKDSPASSDRTRELQNTEGDVRDEKESALDSSLSIPDSSLISGGRENV